MELTKEEKQAIIDEAKASFEKEAKADIEKINKLIADERKAHEEMLKGKITEAEFKEYQEKSHKTETELKERLDKIETKLSRPGIEMPGDKKEVPGAAEYKAAFFNFLRDGRLVLEEKVQKYLESYQKKALVSDTTGQILFPEELEAEIYRALPKINVIRRYATVRPTGRDKIRRRSLTEVLVGWGKLELGKEAVETDVVPGEAWQYVEDMEGLAKIGKDELADTDVALEGIITDSFARAQADKEEEGFIKGTGHTNQQPDGILNGTTITRVLTVAADAIAIDDVLNLIYAVPAQYRQNGVLFFPSSTHLALRLLKSEVEKIYLWQPNVQAGQPATFAGYPIEASEDIPAIGSSTSCDIGFFGDLRAGYRILDRQGMTVQRILELFTLAGLVGILVSKRVGGGVIRPDAIRILREHA